MKQIRGNDSGNYNPDSMDQEDMPYTVDEDFRDESKDLIAVSRFIGGDMTGPEAWSIGETVSGVYIGYHILEFEGKKVPLFNVLETNGTLVKFLGSSQLVEMVYLQPGSQVSVTFQGVGKSSKGRNVKRFLIHAGRDFMAARYAAICEQLRNPGSKLQVPAPLPIGELEDGDALVVLPE